MKRKTFFLVICFLVVWSSPGICETLRSAIAGTATMPASKGISMANFSSPGDMLASGATKILVKMPAGTIPAEAEKIMFTSAHLLVGTTMNTVPMAGALSLAANSIAGSTTLRVSIPAWTILAKAKENISTFAGTRILTKMDSSYAATIFALSATEIAEDIPVYSGITEPVKDLLQ